MSIGGSVRIEVTERETPVFGGTAFGAVGTYERLHGRIFGDLDPTHRLNADIVNIDKAARNRSGNVEYQCDFRILKPVDLDCGNGCLVYDVPNRGNQPIMPRLNGAPDGGHPQHAGNGFLAGCGKTQCLRRALSSSHGKLAPWLLKTVFQAGCCIDFVGFCPARADFGHGYAAALTSLGRRTRL